VFGGTEQAGRFSGSAQGVVSQTNDRRKVSKSAMELRDLDLNLLLVLDALFEEGTLTRTAQRLRLSQPTVSASLVKLRGILGDELFVRANGKMQPTARALALRGAVASVLKTVRLEILSQAGFDPDSETGAFTVGLPDIGELEFLPRPLDRLARDAPQAALKSVVATPVEVSTAMDLGEIDLAVGYFPDLTTSVFKQQFLFQHSSACVVRRDHPTIGPVLTLDDYLSAKHVVIAQKGRIQRRGRFGCKGPASENWPADTALRQYSFHRRRVRSRRDDPTSVGDPVCRHLRFAGARSAVSDPDHRNQAVVAPKLRRGTRVSSGFATWLLRCVRTGRPWASGE
jgi:DNA-binding transcriptional LysR family regulator